MMKRFHATILLSLALIVATTSTSIRSPWNLPLTVRGGFDNVSDEPGTNQADEPEKEEKKEMEGDEEEAETPKQERFMVRGGDSSDEPTGDEPEGEDEEKKQDGEEEEETPKQERSMVVRGGDSDEPAEHADEAEGKDQEKKEDGDDEEGDEAPKQERCMTVRGGDSDEPTGDADVPEGEEEEGEDEEGEEAPKQERVSSKIPRGGSEYSVQLEGVKSDVIERAGEAIKELEKAIVEEGSIVAGFGQKADTICNQALEDFAQQAPATGDDDASAAAAYDRKLEELEAAIDAPLQVLYLRQLGLLREQALQGYRSATRTSGASDYEAMMVADGQFSRDAQEATREGSDWDYAMERAYLQQIMNNIAESSKRAMDVQMKSAQQSQTAMQFLQQQQQMIQQLQMQLYGQTSPWNLGVAYRIPDTNFNLQGSYQQGRANIQLSCVPDEYAPMLGPNGFTNGVGPGNLGLSLNLSV